MSEWKAVGRVANLLKVTRADPQRTLTSTEACAIVGCRQKGFAAAIKYAVANKALFVRSFGSGVPMLLRGSPFPPDFNEMPRRGGRRIVIQKWKEGREMVPERGWETDPEDPRIGRVVLGWTPPVMRHVRGGE